MIKFTPGQLVFTQSVKLDEILVKKIEKMPSKKVEEIVQKVINKCTTDPETVDVTIVDGIVTCTIDPAKGLSLESIPKNSIDSDGNLTVNVTAIMTIDASAEGILESVISVLKAAKVKGFTSQLTLEQLVEKIKLHKECMDEFADKMKEIWGDALEEMEVNAPLSKEIVNEKLFKEAVNLIHAENEASDSEPAAQPS